MIIIKCRLFLICIFFFKIGYAQSIILRPGLGIKIFNTKTDYSLPNNLDATFSGKHTFSKLAVTASFEIMNEKGSYEITFTSQQLASAAYTNFVSAGITQSHTEGGGISQFQFVYNRFLKDNDSLVKNVVPFFGLGMGIGINRPSSFYDSSYYNSIFYSSMYPSEFIDFSQSNKSLSKISYSLVFKLGISVKKDNIERLRIYGLYNLGLNKLVKSDITYYHSQNKYFGSSTTKGSQFSFMVTAPIYLKRKK